MANGKVLGVKLDAQAKKHLEEFQRTLGRASASAVIRLALDRLYLEVIGREGVERGDSGDAS